MIRFAKYIFSILVATSFSATSTAASLQEIKTLIDSAKYQKALVIMRGVMDKPQYGKNGDWNKYYGQCLCLTGNYTEAVAPLQFAQKTGRSGAIYYLAIVKQHLYEFDEAAELITLYKKKYCKAGSEWDLRCDSILARCEQGKNAVEHVKDYIILDSLTLPEESFAQQYRLGKEAGRFVSSLGGEICFISALGDYQLRAEGDTIYETSLNGNREWEEWRPLNIPLAGKKAYPYLRSDGETLLFAAINDDGLGGWDLYSTTRDADNTGWYAPERLPMPLNSQYDDLALGIDETHMVGWWATNRNATPGWVTVYLYQLDDEAGYLEGAQPDRGRIVSLAQTWRDSTGYAALVNECLASKPSQRKTTYTVNIPISDDLTYHGEYDFVSTQAREAYVLSLSIGERLSTVEKETDDLRTRYHDAAPSKRKIMRQIILDLEFQEQNLAAQLAKKQKEYRNLEIKARGK